MRVHHYRCPTPMNLAQGFTKLPNNERIKSSRRLIKKENAWFTDQTLGNSDLLLHAFGTLGKGKGFELRQSESLQTVVNRLVRDALSVERTVVPSGLFDCEIKMIVRFLWEVGNVFVEIAPKLRPLSHDFDLARCWFQQAKETVHGGRFACTVPPYKGEEISVAHF